MHHKALQGHTKQKSVYYRVWAQHITDFLSTGALVFMCIKSA